MQKQLMITSELLQIVAYYIISAYIIEKLFFYN